MDIEGGDTGVKGRESVVEGMRNGGGGGRERWLMGRPTVSGKYGKQGLWLGTVTGGKMKGVGKRWSGSWDAVGRRAGMKYPLSNLQTC